MYLLEILRKNLRTILAVIGIVHVSGWFPYAELVFMLLVLLLFPEPFYRLFNRVLHDVRAYRAAAKLRENIHANVNAQDVLRARALGLLGASPWSTP
jgi:hypothetical protein